MADATKTVALFRIAAGLFMTAFVINDVMGKHGRYVPVTYGNEQVVVLEPIRGMYAAFITKAGRRPA
jgi:hypothetical protein